MSEADIPTFGLATRLARSPGPLSAPPLDRSSVTAFEDGEIGEFVYRRNGHRTERLVEEILGDLEGGHAVLFPSGMSAVLTVLLATTEPGATVAVADDAFYGVGVLLRTELERWGLRVAEFDQLRPAPREASLVWLEAPSQPFMRFPDIAAHARSAREAGTVLVVDATSATPVLLRPLEHGADIVIHSATKFLAGHGDVLLGTAICRSAEQAERLRSLRTAAGIVASADDAWLLLRSLRTLELRVRRQSESAAEIARRLASHPAVERVLYPGLGDEIAARYMAAFGGLMSFQVRGGAAAARAVERSVSVIKHATSFGGARSSLETRHRWEPRVPADLIRLSIGLEDVDDLWPDLDRSLEEAARAGGARRSRVVGKR